MQVTYRLRGVKPKRPLVGASSAQFQAVDRLTNNGSKFRILLVEDNPCDAELTEALLGQFLGCQIRTVFTKVQFEEALEKLKPDFIISDAGLPSFDGMTALRIATEKRPEIPVIFFTGNNDPQKKAEAVSKGAVAYVCKDDASALLGVLQRLCAHAPSDVPASERGKD